jgi:hypothetical protein
VKKDYRVISYESILVATTYYVSSDSPEEAEKQCREGIVKDFERDIIESTWIETVLVEEV